MGDEDDMESCRTTKVTNGVHIVKSSLDSCGTKLTYKKDEPLSFNNILKVTSRVSSNGILFNNDVKVPGTEYYKVESTNRVLSGQRDQV